MTEPFLIRALMAGLGLAFIAAPLGCFVVWRRMAYFGETVAQAGLMGVALGALFSLNVTASVLAVTLAISLLLLVLSRQDLVPFDSLLGVLAHATLAIGVIAAYLVRGPQVDLMSFLFGDIFAITIQDIRWIYFGGFVAFVALLWIWRPLMSVAVHEDLAAAEGVPVDLVKTVFVLILALVTIAFLIIPAAAARPLSETPEQMAFFATIFAMLAVVLGLFVSVSMDAPGGPSIVVVLSMTFAISMATLAFRSRL
jgi:zinc transport system permease protein